MGKSPAHTLPKTKRKARVYVVANAIIFRCFCLSQFPLTRFLKKTLLRYLSLSSTPRRRSEEFGKTLTTISNNLIALFSPINNDFFNLPKVAFSLFRFDVMSLSRFFQTLLIPSHPLSMFCRVPIDLACYRAFTYWICLCFSGRSIFSGFVCFWNTFI